MVIVNLTAGVLNRLKNDGTERVSEDGRVAARLSNNGNSLTLLDLRFGCKKAFYSKQKFTRLVDFSTEYAVFMTEKKIDNEGEPVSHIAKAVLDHQRSLIDVKDEVRADLGDLHYYKSGTHIYLWCGRTLGCGCTRGGLHTYHLMEGIRDPPPLQPFHNPARIDDDGQWIYYAHPGTGEIIWEVERFHVETKERQQVWTFTQTMWAAEQRKIKEEYPSLEEVIDFQETRISVKFGHSSGSNRSRIG